MPQPVQKMTFEGLFRFVARQLGLHFGIGLRHDEALLRRVQRHIQFRLPNPERVKANLRNLALQSRGLSGGDILNVCLNAIHAGSRDPGSARWVVTEKMLVREIRRAMLAKEKHSGKEGSGRRIGLGGEAVRVCFSPARARLTDRTAKVEMRGEGVKFIHLEDWNQRGGFGQ